MNRRRFLFFSPFLALSLLLVPVAAAADPADAEVQLRRANDRLRELLRDDDANPEVGSIIDGLLDYDGLAERALRAHWERLGAERRAEFLSLFRQLVAKSYRENLKETLDNIAIDFLGWDLTESRTVLVRTRVRKIQTRRSRRAETPINYEMRRVGDVWKVIDVVTDDVSLVQSSQDQFNRIIGGAADFDAGWNELVALMHRKLEE
jgi:phospholipid transport system substrate-binding protein